MTTCEEGGQGLTEAGKGLDSVLRRWESWKAFQLGDGLGTGERPWHCRWRTGWRGPAGCQEPACRDSNMCATTWGSGCRGECKKYQGSPGAPGDTMRPVPADESGLVRLFLILL